jgi:ER lumen protein retaining receptor
MVVLWIFEFGYILQHIAVISQIMKIRKDKSTEGISLDTNILFLIGGFARAFWFWDSMLKNFWLTYVELIVAIGSLCYIIYLYMLYKDTNFVAKEIKMPIYLQLVVLLPVVLLLSFIFHPGSKGKYYFTLQMMVSLNIFSEAIGLLPQFYMIKKSGDQGNLSKSYIICLGIARFFRLLFWLKMYSDGMSFISLIIADLLHLIFLFVFIFNAAKKWDAVILPSQVDGTSKRIY